MSDAATSGPYETVTIKHDEHAYTFSFYKGFVRSFEFTPPGGTPISVYRQGDAIFHCADTEGPLPVSTISIGCSSLGIEVELEVNDGPLRPPTYRGCIDKIEVFLQRSGAELGSQHEKVKVAKGARNVQRLVVLEDGSIDDGVEALQASDGGTVTVQNHATTCPPTCVGPPP